MNRFSQTLGLSMMLLALTACVHKPKPLYVWGSFPRYQYDTLLHEGADKDNQLRAMEMQAEKVLAKNAQLPPGFRAHLGMLYLSAGKVEQGRQMLVAEKNAFPESSPYMDRLLKRFENKSAPQITPSQGAL